MKNFLARIVANVLFSSLIFSLIFASRTAAAGQTVSVDLAAGVPQLLSFELAYWGLGPVVIGVGFGSLPVNKLLKQNIPMDSRAVSGGYTLFPDASYSFLTISAFLRWFPFNDNKGSGTFFELNVARWKFSSNVTGDLQDDSSGATIGSALTGNIDFQQPMASLLVGYRSMLGSSFFLHGAIGATYLFTPVATTSVGGSLNTVLPFANQATIDSFDQAKTDIKNQVDSGVNTLKATTKIIPALWLGMGWVF